MGKPTKLPRWGDVTGSIVEPPESKKDIGTEVEIPPLDYENWREDLQNQWIKHLSEIVNYPVATAQGGNLLVDVSDGKFPTQVSLSIVSITRAAAIATVTTTQSTGFSTGDVVTISGSDQAEYNGTFVITANTFTEFEYTLVGTPVTPATGTMEARSEQSYNALSTFSGSSIVLDPSSLLANEQRIDAIVLNSTPESTGVLAVVLGVPSINIASPPFITANQSVVALVKLVNGQTEILQPDIMTNFDPYAVRRFGNNFIEGDFFGLKSQGVNGSATVSVNSRGTGNARYRFIRDDFQSANIEHNSNGLEIVNRVLGGSTTLSKELVISNNGGFTYRDGISGLRVPVMQLAASISVGVTGSMGDVLLGLGRNGAIIGGGITYIGRDNVTTQTQTGNWIVWQRNNNGEYFLTVPEPYSRSDFIYEFIPSDGASVVNERNSIIKASDNTNDGTGNSIIIEVGRQGSTQVERNGQFVINVFRVQT